MYKRQALSCPVGFKNGTDGNTRIAVDAIRAARASHMFLSPDKNGQMTIYQTSGNPYGHIIMRGGKKMCIRDSCVTSDINMPRIPSMKAILGAGKKPVNQWQASDIGWSQSTPLAELTGIRVPPQTERKHIILDNDSPEAIRCV